MGKYLEKYQVMTATVLLIPRQEGTKDACWEVSRAANEGDEPWVLKQVELSSDLITMCWIHSHPSFTCFFSNVDNHATAVYQRGYAPFFGIVVGKKDDHPNTPFGVYGIFCVKDKFLPLLLSCPPQLLKVNPQHNHRHPDYPDMLLYSDLHEVASHVKIVRDLPEFRHFSYFTPAPNPIPSNLPPAKQDKIQKPKSAGQMDYGLVEEDEEEEKQAPDQISSKRRSRVPDVNAR
jgi:proteasome lid subunit RPN8/RPN11